MLFRFAGIFIGFALLGLTVGLPACSKNDNPPDAAVDTSGEGDGDADAPDAGCDADGAAGDDGGLADERDGGAAGDGDGSGDAGGDPGSSLWGWCPASTEYIGGDWKWRLRVTESALYCGTFDESRSLEEERYRKSQLRFVAGDYPLPNTSGEYPFRLPVCLKFLEGQETPLLASTGLLRADIGDLHFNLQLHQPLLTSSGTAWEFVMYLSGVMPAGGDTITLDGSHMNQCTGTTPLFFDFFACRGDCQDWVDARMFDSCDFSEIAEGVHQLTFSGGSIEIGLRIGCSMASTEPGIFSRATGTLDGTAFDQRDYWKLIYNPQHHHFSRDAAVLFERPIGPACGIKVEGMDPFCCRPLRPDCYNECQSTLSLIDCDLAAIEKRAIETESWEK